MDKVEEALVESLEIFIDRVRNGEINLQAVDTSMVEPISMTMERNYFRKKICIEYSEVAKKRYKTHQEIYEELFNMIMNNIEKNSFDCGSLSDAKRRANIYASGQTARVWREQYE